MSVTVVPRLAVRPWLSVTLTVTVMGSVLPAPDGTGLGLSAENVPSVARYEPPDNDMAVLPLTLPTDHDMTTLCTPPGALTEAVIVLRLGSPVAEQLTSPVYASAIVPGLACTEPTDGAAGP